MQIKKSVRKNRVATEIKKILSEFLLRGSIVNHDSINSSLISITEVTVSSCLQHAQVYTVSLSNNVKSEDCIRFLEKYTPQLRYHIGANMRLKFVPDLKFFIDSSLEYAVKIEALLKKIHYNRDSVI